MNKSSIVYIVYLDTWVPERMAKGLDIAELDSLICANYKQLIICSGQKDIG